MKFNEFPYTRPDFEAYKQSFNETLKSFSSALDAAEQRSYFRKINELRQAVDSMSTLASIRHSIDTRDTFYDGEEKFWNTFGPELEEYEQAWKAAMLDSPFRKDFSAEYGDLMFLNAEIARKCFKPEIIPEMQQENDLTQERLTENGMLLIPLVDRR